MPPGDWDAGERGIACLPDRVGEFQDGVGKAIDYARALGCTQLHTMAGIRPEGAHPDKLDQTYVENLRFAAEETKKAGVRRSEEHTSELQSLMRISYAVFCLKKKKSHTQKAHNEHTQSQQASTDQVKDTCMITNALTT